MSENRIDETSINYILGSILHRFSIYKIIELVIIFCVVYFSSEILPYIFSKLFRCLLWKRYRKYKRGIEYIDCKDPRIKIFIPAPSVSSHCDNRLTFLQMNPNSVYLLTRIIRLLIWLLGFYISFKLLGIDLFRSVLGLGLFGTFVAFSTKIIVQPILAGVGILYLDKFRSGSIIKEADNYYQIRCIGLMCVKKRDVTNMIELIKKHYAEQSGTLSENEFNYIHVYSDDDDYDEPIRKYKKKKKGRKNDVKTVNIDFGDAIKKNRPLLEEPETPNTFYVLNKIVHISTSSFLDRTFIDS